MNPFARSLMLVTVVLAGCSTARAQEAPPIPGGQLQILGEGVTAGVCPLKHTDVTADITGFVGRVTVKQTFQNPTDQKIEAIYIFPLPQDAAVDDMLMQVGDRRIVGQIKEREEAREIYEAAKAAGHVASLLDQERPNIFTQSVANIEPGVEVVIEISYTETLKYEDAVYEWVFPMVVGPRYIPGGGSAPAPMTTGQDTPQVPDASKITPPVTPEGTRAGHDISLTVTIDGGLPIHDLRSVQHEIDAVTLDARPDSPVRISLKDAVQIPNKDFVLRYRLAGNAIGDAFLVHEDERGKYFTLVLQPPQRVAPTQVVARELIFVLDTSGSMSGLPIEAAKKVMSRLIDTMRPADTFNLITFSGETSVLWKEARPATNANIAEAQKFLSGRRGGGGTEMMKAIEAALVKTSSAAAVRIVCFMTDGYVGNDMEIIGAVKKHAGTTRVFSFGVGSSVNRFLLDGMAQAGRGEVEYVPLDGDAEASMKRFHERLLAPVLTDITIDWGDLPIADVYPVQIPDLFSAKPIMIHGRLTGPAAGTITLRGLTGAGPYEERIETRWPTTPPAHVALASLWARAKVADLMMQDYAALQQGNFPEELKAQITALGLEYRLMTQFTSFVAVEELMVTAGGEPTKITVPVEIPEGVSYEGVFGGGQGGDMRAKGALKYRYDVGVARGGRALFRESARPAAAGVPVTLTPAPPTSPTVEVREQDEDGDGVVVLQLPPGERARLKLAEALRELADKVAKEGQDGTLTVGKLKVVNYRVDVMIYLSDASEQTLNALKALGFEQTAESKTVALRIGSIDVRKLADLAALESVLRVQPVVAP